MVLLVVALLAATGMAACQPIVPACDINWIGPSGDLWSVAENWDLDAIPGVGQRACAAAGSSIVVTGVEHVGSLASEGTVTIATGATLTVDAGAKAQTLDVDLFGTLDGSGTAIATSLDLDGTIGGSLLAVAGDASIDGGTVAGSAVLALIGSTSLSGTTFICAGATIANGGSLSVGPSAQLRGDLCGTGAFVNGLGGTTTIADNANTSFETPVVNNGTFVLGADAQFDVPRFDQVVEDGETPVLELNAGAELTATGDAGIAGEVVTHLAVYSEVGRFIVGGTVDVTTATVRVELDGWLPAPGELFDFVEAATVLGPFADETLPDVPPYVIDVLESPTTIRLQLATPFTFFSDPSVNYPYGIAAGPDGNLWFANYGSSSIGRITLDGVVTEFDHPAIGTATSITAGADGNLWFTMGYGEIGRITTAGDITILSDPDLASPQNLTAGPDGNVWFVTGDSTIGFITPSGDATAFSDPMLDAPFGITTGPDGNLWFVQPSGTVGRITTAGVVTTFADPGITSPFDITAGPDGNLWFTSQNKIGRITTTGTITMFDQSGQGAFEITTGPDGNLWFTNSFDDSIGSMTTDGTMTRYVDPGVSGPYGIATGADGNIWFTNATASGIGRITL